MKAVYRKSDGAYVDNEQSWANVPVDLAAAVAEKHGGSAKDYAVQEADKPHLKKLAGGQLVEDAEKVARSDAQREAARQEAGTLKRIERRRMEADLKLAQASGDNDAVQLILKQLEDVG